MVYPTKTLEDLESITVSDIEIARAAKKKPIFEIGEALNIPAADLLPFGHDKAKISQNFINSVYRAGRMAN